MSHSLSKIIALAAAVVLLGLSACKSVNEPAAQPAAAQPAPAEAHAAPQAAPQATELAASSLPASTPATVAMPADPAPAPAAAKPAGEAKPSKPVAVAPAAKPETSAAPAAKASILTKEQALALAGKGNCLACHKIESKVVGPAWKDVAAKYKGDANAVSTITSHIKSGGSFGWKFGTMPPRGGSNISDADVANLAKFIASLK